MRIAAVTMVHQGYATLARWCAHYGALVGPENLYIVSHGDDPVHREIAGRANVIGIPHTGLDRFDFHRHAALDGLSKFLNTYLDVVLKVDVDEFVFVDPEIHGSLHDCLESTPGDAWFCLGFNLLPSREDPLLDPDVCYSRQRRFGAFSALYSKAIAGRNGMFIGFHGAKDPKNKDASRMVLPKGLYLAHVRHAENAPDTDFDSFNQFSRVRGSSGGGMFIEDFELVEAAGELEACYNLIAAGFGRYRRKRPTIWTVPKVRRRKVFELPERFVGLF